MFFLFPLLSIDVSSSRTLKIYLQLPCRDTISYNLSTEVISLWDNKIYLDLDLKSVDDMRRGRGGVK